MRLRDLIQLDFCLPRIQLKISEGIGSIFGFEIEFKNFICVGFFQEMFLQWNKLILFVGQICNLKLKAFIKKIVSFLTYRF